jgi:peptide-methionine (S)-S-oxide reductase
MFHDPTTLNRQGNDAGTQYASVIYCYDTKQEEIAKKVKSELQSFVDAGKVKYTGRTVTTDIRSSTKFYVAQADHQAYLENNPFGYCNHAYRFKAWPK